MKYAELLAQARDAITVRRVYGDPYESGGAIVIPAASVGGGGGGGGTGNSADGDGSGEGVAFGVGAKPVGAYVLRDGRLTERMWVSTSRRGLTHRLTDLGSSTGFVGLGGRCSCALTGCGVVTS